MKGQHELPLRILWLLFPAGIRLASAQGIAAPEIPGMHNGDTVFVYRRDLSGKAETIGQMDVVVEGLKKQDIGLSP